MSDREKRTKESSPSWPVTARQEIEGCVKPMIKEKGYTPVGTGQTRFRQRETTEQRRDNRLRSERDGADIGE